MKLRAIDLIITYTKYFAGNEDWKWRKVIAPAIAAILVLILLLLLVASIYYLGVYRRRSQTQSQDPYIRIPNPEIPISQSRDRYIPIGNRMAVSIFFDEYENQAAGLEAIRGDASGIRRVLEDPQKFRYKFPSEDPTLFEPHQFENQGRLVPAFREFLEKWTERQPEGTVVDTFLLYVHGHGAQVLGEQCLFTNKWTAIPLRELENLVADHVHPIRYYIIMDCCSNTKNADEKAETRVRKARSVQRPENFRDKIIHINAAAEGYTASAETGKTLTSPLVSVLEKGEGGVPLRELQFRLREEQIKQGSNNFPIVDVPLNLVDQLFPF